MKRRNLFGIAAMLALAVALCPASYAAAADADSLTSGSISAQSQKSPAGSVGAQLSAQATYKGMYEYKVGDLDSWGGSQPIKKPGYILNLEVLKKKGKKLSFKSMFIIPPAPDAFKREWQLAVGCKRPRFLAAHVLVNERSMPIHEVCPHGIERDLRVPRLDIAHIRQYESEPESHEVIGQVIVSPPAPKTIIESIILSIITIDQAAADQARLCLKSIRLLLSSCQIPHLNSRCSLCAPIASRPPKIRLVVVRDKSGPLGHLPTRPFYVYNSRELPAPALQFRSLVRRRGYATA